MLRMSLAAFLLTLSAGASAVAKDYSDTAHNFRLTVPDGWLAEQDTEKEVALFLGSPRMGETQGGCALIADADAETKDLTQADIDAGLGSNFGEAFWTQAFSDDNAFSGFTIENTGTETVNGIKRYYAQVRYSERDKSGTIVNSKSRQVLAFTPGWHYVIVCSALAEQYGREDADFKVIFASFAPLSSVPVASNAPAGTRSLTLYSQARFGGVSRIVTMDTPNLALSGWHGDAASVSVAGGGAWQVCTAQDYRGTCRVVSAAVPDGLGATAILSVRRAPPGAPSASELATAMRSLKRRH